MGQSKHDGLAVPGQVVLAHEPDFTIGALTVRPATRQVENGDRHETLEPRVMQVLVALYRAGGIVTRDELIERCWEGRIVTDDAINRVLSRIRHIADSIGAGSFGIETIARVGYRLVETDGGIDVRAATEPVRPRASLADRRQMLAGGAAVGLTAAAAGALWFQPWKYRPRSEAVELFQRGKVAERVGTPDQTRQSASYFERAVSLDPDYADAWGALALAYTHNLDGFAEAEFGSLPGRIRSAAQRALELDKDNADAHLALASIKPAFRNWAAMERELRTLCDRYPRHWLCLGRTAALLYQVGRFNEGVAFHRKLIEVEPLIAGPHAFLASALSSAGRIQEADAVLRKAHDHWPAHPLLWSTKFNHLLFSGRPQSAIAFAMDPEALPSGFGPMQVDWRLRLARAVDSGSADDVSASVEHQGQLALDQTTNVPQAAPIFALLGRLDLTFASLDRYFFNRGSFGPPRAIGRYTRRFTNMLFTPPMASARADPRFAAMLSQLGLEDYWRATGSVPDFRRR